MISLTLLYHKKYNVFALLTSSPFSIPVPLILVCLRNKKRERDTKNPVYSLSYSAALSHTFEIM